MTGILDGDRRMHLLQCYRATRQRQYRGVELSMRYRSCRARAMPSRPAKTDVDVLYAELKALAHQPPSPEREAAYQSRLTRLIELEKEETARMDAFFRARNRSDRRALDDAVRRAEELLAAHENPSARH